MPPPPQSPKTSTSEADRKVVSEGESVRPGATLPDGPTSTDPRTTNPRDQASAPPVSSSTRADDSDLGAAEPEPDYVGETLVLPDRPGNSPEAIGPKSPPQDLVTDFVSDQAAKQELDLALAIALVRSGHLSERELSRAVDNWTVYGTQTLADRLIECKRLPRDELPTWQARANQRVRDAGSAVGEPNGGGGSQVFRARIAHLDSSGRIARMLGLNIGGGVIGGDVARRLFSQFKLIRKLGEGGLGTVWLARDENLRRYVAIKEIRTRGGQESIAAIARFRREAEISGRLEHPGIVPIYQFGTDTDSGRYFYVMRFLGKQTMHDAIAEYHERREAGNHEPLLRHRLLSAFVKLCNAVGHAHSRKVVHRDLKPENVALDSFGQVVLLDWGLAKINDETGSSDVTMDSAGDDLHEASLTLASQVLGSPMYMSPEQAAGRIDEIDERTDVYGLGGILFSILTGRAPHEPTRNKQHSTSVSDLLAGIVGKPVVNPREVVPSVPRELASICRKAMSHKRYLRYQSAAAMAEDVERFMAGDHVSAYEEPPIQRAKRWVAAHPRLSQFAALMMLLVLSSIVIVGYSLRQTQVAEQEFRFQRASDVAKELAFELQSQADHGIRDSRFLTGLPPVQMIIEAMKREADPSVHHDATDAVARMDALPSTSGMAASENDIEIWRSRLASIFEGVLRGNESYQTIVFLRNNELVSDKRGTSNSGSAPSSESDSGTDTKPSSGTDDEPVDEVFQLVKMERNMGADIVRRVPDSLLKSFPVDPDGPDFQSMLPGDVILLTSDQINRNAPTRYRDSLSLTAVNAVFDEFSGEQFGVMAVQLDLRLLIQRRLDASGHDAEAIYVTNGRGVIQLAYLRGSLQPSYKGTDVSEILPVLNPVFGTQMKSQYSDGTSVFATRLRLGTVSAQSQAELGIVVHTLD